MSELLFGLCFRCCFQQNPQVFCSKWVCFVAPERKLFYGNFCSLTLSSVCYNKGLNFYKLYYTQVLFSISFLGIVAPAKVVLGQFLLPVSIERFI